MRAGLRASDGQSSAMTNEMGPPAVTLTVAQSFNSIVCSIGAVRVNFKIDSSAKKMGDGSPKSPISPAY